MPASLRQSSQLCIATVTAQCTPHMPIRRGPSAAPALHVRATAVGGTLDKVSAAMDHASVRGTAAVARFWNTLRLVAPDPLCHSTLGPSLPLTCHSILCTLLWHAWPHHRSRTGWLSVSLRAPAATATAQPTNMLMQRQECCPCEVACNHCRLFGRRRCCIGRPACSIWKQLSTAFDTHKHSNACSYT